MALGIAGFLINLLPVELAPGTQMVFGGVAYLLAAVALGPLPGFLAAGIASARTLWLWNHPYAWLIFSVEALVVGYLSHRKGVRPLVADFTFWLFLGVPLLFLTYYMILGVHGATAALLFLKQPLNGLIDAVIAETLFLLPAARRALGVQGAPRLRSALASVVTLAAVTPALAFGIWLGRQEWDRSVNRARERVSLYSQSYASKLEQYVVLHERAVRSLAESGERRGDFNVDQLQRLVSVGHVEFPGFVNVFAADSRGTIVAFHPLTDPRGGTLRNLSVSDRRYFAELLRTRKTVISNVIVARGGAEEPVVAIAHPIILGDTFAGFVLGALDLKGLPPPVPGPEAGSRLRVADPNGTLVFDSRHAYRPGELPHDLRDSLVLEAVRALGTGGTTISQPPSNAAAPAATLASRTLIGASKIPSLGWWVWMEESYSGIQAFVSAAYVRLLALLIAVMLASLMVGNALAIYLSRPLLRVRKVAASLAEGDLSARVGRLQAGVPLEIEEMGRGFDEMVGALAERTKELEEVGEIARQASRAKSNFIATMSHELRTPLNAVLGHLQLLEMEIHGPVTEAQIRALGRIGTASRHLRGLIDEVLSFARLEAGKVEVQTSEVDLTSLAVEVAAMIEPLALEKDLAFTAPPPDAPEIVVTDPDKVRQILINLAGNAVKFTDGGEVGISVRRHDAEVEIRVSDTGSGISAEDEARLFRPFEQLESGLARSHGGTGLGLYLSGEYARVIGGRIEVETEPGRGSVFSLFIPVDAAVDQ